MNLPVMKRKERWSENKTLGASENLLNILTDSGTDQVSENLNETYDNGEIPEDCDLTLIISLMNHIANHYDSNV